MLHAFRWRDEAPRPCPRGNSQHPPSTVAQRLTPTSFALALPFCDSVPTPQVMSCFRRSSAFQRWDGYKLCRPAPLPRESSTNPPPTLRSAALATTCRLLAPFPNGSKSLSRSHRSRCAQTHSARLGYLQPRLYLQPRWKEACASSPRVRRQLPRLSSGIPAVLPSPVRSSRPPCVQFSGPMNGLSNARVGSATADVAAHRFVNIFIRGFVNLRQQHGCAHDLPGLAVPALRHVQLDPRLLQRMRQIAGQPLDGYYVLPFRARHRRHARADRLSLQMHCARSAERHPAAKFRAGQSQRVSQHPQERSRWIHVHLDGLPIYKEICHRNFLPCEWQPWFPFWMAERNRRLRRRPILLWPILAPGKRASFASNPSLQT